MNQLSLNTLNNFYWLKDSRSGAFTGVFTIVAFHNYQTKLILICAPSVNSGKGLTKRVDIHVELPGNNRGIKRHS